MGSPETRGLSPVLPQASAGLGQFPFPICRIMRLNLNNGFQKNFFFTAIILFFFSNKTLMMGAEYETIKSRGVNFQKIDKKEKP